MMKYKINPLSDNASKVFLSVQDIYIMNTLNLSNLLKYFSRANTRFAPTALVIAYTGGFKILVVDLGVLNISSKCISCDPLFYKKGGA